MVGDNVINVGLYGDGSRKARRHAEYVSCEKASVCSLYHDKKCFRVREPFSRNYCPFGSVRTVNGGTRQSKAFDTISDEAFKHDKYNVLEYPNGCMVARIGNQALLVVPHVKIEESGGKLYMDDKDVLFSDLNILVDVAILTSENLHTICAFKPRFFQSCEVNKDYQENTIPTFLFQLRQVFPEQYAAFVTEYPEYAEKKPNFVGKWAKLSTCNRNATYQDNNGEFRFDGDWLVCENYNAWLLFGGHTEVRVRVTDDMVVKIADNDQVLPDTVFV